METWRVVTLSNETMWLDICATDPEEVEWWPRWASLLIENQHKQYVFLLLPAIYFQVHAPDPRAVG